MIPLQVTIGHFTNKRRKVVMLSRAFDDSSNSTQIGVGRTEQEVVMLSRAFDDSSVLSVLVYTLLVKIRRNALTSVR